MPVGFSLEKRASRIVDPVERLKYLRKHAVVPKPSAKPVPRLKPTLLFAGILVAVVVAAFPAGTPEVEATQQRLTIPGVPATTVLPAPAEVWKVDSSDNTEVYSNGLVIDLTFATANRPRAEYPVFSLHGSEKPVETSHEPRGIVYHTTESHLAPFEEESNRQLKRLGRNLLEILRQEHSYHYLIDRFGRVYRVVEESDAANHAGYSAWADSRGLYVNLNDSFIGVSFEGQTEAADQVTAAQVTAARMLTEMLRSRYGIAPENCVTHAQISVNPQNMLIANHADWAQGFPFEAVGLPDNYSIALPSMYALGFNYDDVFLKVSGGGWPGLQLAEKQVTGRAVLEGVTEARYRSMLRHRYKSITAALKFRVEGGN